MLGLIPTPRFAGNRGVAEMCSNSRAKCQPFRLFLDQAPSLPPKQRLCFQRYLTKPPPHTPLINLPTFADSNASLIMSTRGLQGVGKPDAEDAARNQDEANRVRGKAGLGDQRFQFSGAFPRRPHGGPPREDFGQAQDRTANPSSTGTLC